MNAWGPPAAEECSPFYRKYIDELNAADLFAALDQVTAASNALVARIPQGMDGHRYAPDKWSIAEVLQHLVDCERIFQYRALRFARNDRTELPGFDENSYAQEAAANVRSITDVYEELLLVRRSTVALFRSFPDGNALRSGPANGRTITVRALGWTIAGHHLHHLRILEQRYL
jgi:hypothetical protein